MCVLLGFRAENYFNKTMGQATIQVYRFTRSVFSKDVQAYLKKVAVFMVDYKKQPWETNSVLLPTFL